ncbi:MAG: class I SAM-dependent methyltransferase [Smithella sp.]
MKVCPGCNSELLNDSSCGCCGFTAKMIDGFLAFAPGLATNNDNFDATAHARLFQQESNCFWFPERNKLIIWAMNKYFPNTESLLEIGCGTGYVLSGLSSAFPEKKYTGADIFTSGLKFAASRVPQANFIQMDARHIPFNNEFDVVGAFDMIEHVEEDEQALSQMYKAVRHGGGIIATVPQHKWLWSAVDDYGFHKRRYTRAMFGEKITKSGFEVVKITSFMSFLLPIIVLRRGRYLFYSKEIIEETTKEEIKINPVLNYLFSLICMVETRMIKAGVPFPAGGSLLCIAKKR